MKSTAAFLIGMLFAIGIIFAQNTTNSVGVGHGNGTVSNGTAYGCVISNNQIPVSNKTISVANAFVGSKVGTSYFSKYMNLSFAYAYNSSCLEQNGTIIPGNVTYSVLYSYNIPYANGTTTRAIQGFGGPVFFMGTWVTLARNNTVIGYRGPAQPYVIKINESQAIAAAEASGLTNVTGYANIQDGANFFNLSGPFTYYNIVWAVYSNDHVSCGPGWNTTACTAGTYVDVETGKVVGQFLNNPLLVIPLASGGGKLSTLGNFSIYGNGRSGSTSSNGVSMAPYLPYILGLAIAIVVIAVILGHLASKSRSRK